MTYIKPSESKKEIETFAFEILQALVAVPSNSDSKSDMTPSTKDQLVLRDHIGKMFEAMGLKTTYDSCGNVVGFLEGRGKGKKAPSVSFISHLDTVKATRAVSKLNVLSCWNGIDPIPYPKNKQYRVNVSEYPVLKSFVGRDVIYGPGDRPFGLDDKLGLTHLLMLGYLLKKNKANKALSYPPIYLIARTDEEIGADHVSEEIAKFLKEKGVEYVYTVDGVEGFEVNIANFLSMSLRLYWKSKKYELKKTGLVAQVDIWGVRSHTATAYEEGYVNDLELFASFFKALKLSKIPFDTLYYEGNFSERCMGTSLIVFKQNGDVQRAEEILSELTGFYRAKGSNFKLTVKKECETYIKDTTLETIFDKLGAYYTEPKAYIVFEKDSNGWDGLSSPDKLIYNPSNATWHVQFRIRDFKLDAVKARKDDLYAYFGKGVVASRHVLMQKDISKEMEVDTRLYEIPINAGKSLGLNAELKPFRGATGAEPFHLNGMFVCNLGTGYFAPENEKELTTMQNFSDNAYWLFDICQRFSEIKVDS